MINYDSGSRVILLTVTVTVTVYHCYFANSIMTGWYSYCYFYTVFLILYTVIFSVDSEQYYDKLW